MLMQRDRSALAFVPTNWNGRVHWSSSGSFTRSTRYLIGQHHAIHFKAPAITTTTAAFASCTFRAFWVFARSASVYPMRRPPMRRPTAALRVMRDADRWCGADRSLALRALISVNHLSWPPLSRPPRSGTVRRVRFGHAQRQGHNDTR
jgi:hypothetical protein